MKITVDSKGGIVIPGIIRKAMDIHPGDSFFMSMTDEGILLTRLEEVKSVNVESVVVFSRDEEGSARCFTLK
jgi:AbrB family looped-hinge helix DNA binding protein